LQGALEVRFQELRDEAGRVLAHGLHPAIAVVAAEPTERAAAISAALATGGCKVLTATEVDEQLQKAAALAAQEHEAALQAKRASLSEAERAFHEASAAAAKAAHDADAATADLSRFDQLAGRLADAEGAYEAAVRAEAEAARSLAAALAELDRILGQRHAASTSLEQARSSRDRAVPEAVIQQAKSLQAALASAELEKIDAVQQADQSCQAARKASAEARSAVESAHRALREGLTLMSSSVPDWGPGVPLPGLVNHYRDRLAAAAAGAQAAEARAADALRSAKSWDENERRELAVLESAGPLRPAPEATLSGWLQSAHFNPEEPVVADNAFSRFGMDAVASLLNLLAGRGCQAIYLTDDPGVLGWAISLPHEAGGATTAVKRARRPALVAEP
jgi:hypothetical protein